MAEALCHIQLGVVQPSQGHFLHKVAAYDAACRLDAPDGSRYDFERKRGEHVAGGVMLPPGAPAAMVDRATLWDAAAKAERRWDGCPARLVEVALPRDTAREHWADMARAIAQPYVDQGAAVQWDVHCPMGSDGQPQPHVHLIVSTRPLGPDGFGARKLPETPWRAKRGREMRAAIADRLNGCLRAQGYDIHIDPRTHKERGVDMPPPERNVPKRSWEAYKADPDHPAAAPVRGTLADRQARRQLRAAQRAATQATAEIAALGAEYDRRAVGLRPKDRQRVPWSDDWLPPVGGAVTAVERDAKGAVLRLADGGRVLDRGNRLTLAGQVTDAGLDALAAQAARHGWGEVEVTGPPETRDRLARALEARGIQAVNHQPPAAPAVLGRRWAPPRPTPAPEAPRRAQEAPRPRPAPVPAPEVTLPTAAPAYRPPWVTQPGRRKDLKR